jgi:transcriptional regulator with XRE-family HTH domain/methylmalonyl-CoA mutase cobalamin-binding subunit
MIVFKELLKEKRKEKGLSQKEFGKRLGVGQTTIANYESGAREPNYEGIISISKVLEVSIDELLGNDLTSGNDEDLCLDLQRAKDLKPQFLELLLHHKEEEASALVDKFTYDMDSYILVLEVVLKASLYDAGDMWEKGLLTIADEHYISSVIHKIISALSVRYHLDKNQKKMRGQKALCMTYTSDKHIIGSKFAEEYLKLLGFDTLYIGSNIPTQSVIDMIKSNGVTHLAISLTIADYVDGLVNFIKVLRSELKSKTPYIILGGQGIKDYSKAPQELGADGFSHDFESLKALLG